MNIRNKLVFSINLLPLSTPPFKLPNLLSRDKFDYLMIYKISLHTRFRYFEISMQF